MYNDFTERYPMPPQPTPTRPSHSRDLEVWDRDLAEEWPKHAESGDVEVGPKEMMVDQK